jgi:hypothetical protein
MSDDVGVWNIGAYHQGMVGGRTPNIDRIGKEGARFMMLGHHALLAAPFPMFTFSAVRVSAYQFGNFGTAAKLLHSFKLTQ